MRLFSSSLSFHIYLFDFAHFFELLESVFAILVVANEFYSNFFDRISKIHRQVSRKHPKYNVRSYTYTFLGNGICVCPFISCSRFSKNKSEIKRKSSPNHVDILTRTWNDVYFLRYSIGFQLTEIIMYINDSKSYLADLEDTERKDRFSYLRDLLQNQFSFHVSDFILCSILTIFIYNVSYAYLFYLIRSVGSIVVFIENSSSSILIGSEAVYAVNRWDFEKIFTRMISHNSSVSDINKRTQTLGLNTQKAISRS